MNNKELAELAERVRAMSGAELVAFRSGQSEYTSVHTIFFEKEFERRERLEQRKLDLKLMAERVRWRKSAARLTAGASIVAAIVGAIAGATLALWLQPNPTLKQSESPPRSTQQESVPSEAVDRTEKAESVPSKSP